MKSLDGHRWLDQTATISSPTMTQAADGSQYPGSLNTSTVMCEIQPDNSSESREYMRLTGKVRAIGYFSPLTTSAASSAIQRDALLSIEDASGTIRKYRATGPGNRRAWGKDIVLVCPLEEIQ